MTDSALSGTLVIERESRIPPYQQIEQGLIDAIADGRLKVGKRLPPERELAGELGVSRMTLRHALATLESRGLVVRVLGRNGGTYVQEPKIVCDLTMLVGFTEQLRRNGVVAGTKVVSASEIAAAGDVAEALGIAVGTAVFEVERIRLANDLPVALEKSYFPAHRFVGMLDEDMSGSLYQLLDSKYDKRPVAATESLESIIVDSRRAKLLGVAAGAAVMMLQRTAFASDGCPVEYAQDLLRSDRTRIVVNSGLGDAL